MNDLLKSFLKHRQDPLPVSSAASAMHANLKRVLQVLRKNKKADMRTKYENKSENIKLLHKLMQKLII
jgi:hypothetical protein